MICAVLLILAGWNAAAAENNVKFSGTLVALPCTIPDSDRTIQVHMGTVNAHDLYLHQDMPRVPFTLHLEDCDPTVDATVSVAFTGTEDIPGKLPGYLAMDGSAPGIAIGLENSNGEQIKVNHATPPLPLLAGNNELNFRAFIAGEPEAVKSRSIRTGDFSTTATLKIFYE